jgi:hypothetical protein
VKSESLKKDWYFMCGKWLSTGEDDGLIERDLFPQEKDGVASAPLVTYKVSVTTGDRPGAGTDAKVTLNVYGEHGESGDIKLENGRNNFERNQTDVFGFEVMD